MLSAGDDDYQKLQLGGNQLRLLTSGGGSRVVVALTHHPLAWLSDAISAEAWFETQVDVHLSGHLHEADATFTQHSRGTERIRLQAGSVHGDEGGDGAHGYAFGQVRISEDGAACLEYWPRIWKQNRWQSDGDRLPSDKTSFVFNLGRRLRAAEAQRRDDEATARSAKQLELLGNRRTAYPTDLSIAELAERGLLLDVTATRRGNGGTIGVEEMTAMLSGGESLLLLGEPGVGKTVATYLLHRQLLSVGVVPVVVNAVAFAERTAHRSGGTPESVEDKALAGAEILIVDGLDEALASDLSPLEIGDVLSELRRWAPLVATCRAHEFDTELLSVVDVGAFNDTAVIEGWDIGDFEEFCNRLERAGLLASAAGLTKAAAQSEALSALVRVPLLARMLTFVVGAAAEVADRTALYDLYLRKLARSVEERLVRINCGEDGVFGEWQQLSLAVFRQGLLAGDALPGAEPTRILAATGRSVECAQVIASGVLDYTTGGGELIARYRHYTFYEFFVASAIAAELAGAAARGEGRCWQIFRQDLPREVRRHLSRLLRRMPAVNDLLLSQFEALVDDVGDETDWRVVGILLAYFLGRADLGSGVLGKLHDKTSDVFLRTSLSWALANAGDEGATESYLDEMADPRSEAALYNRGYLLYYHGDIGGGPPYLDDDSSRPWDRTRAAVLELVGRSGYANEEPPARRALDLFTLGDFCRSRGEVLDEDAAKMVEEAVAAVVTSAEGLGERLTSIWAEVRA